MRGQGEPHLVGPKSRVPHLVQVWDPRLLSVKSEISGMCLSGERLACRAG